MACNDFLFHVFLYLGLGWDSVYTDQRAASTAIKLLPNPKDLKFYGDDCINLGIYQQPMNYIPHMDELYSMYNISTELL